MQTPPIIKTPYTGIPAYPFYTPHRSGFVTPSDARIREKQREIDTPPLRVCTLYMEGWAGIMQFTQRNDICPKKN